MSNSNNNLPNLVPTEYKYLLCTQGSYPRLEVVTVVSTDSKYGLVGICKPPYTVVTWVLPTNLYDDLTTALTHLEREYEALLQQVVSDRQKVATLVRVLSKGR